MSRASLAAHLLLIPALLACAAGTAEAPRVPASPVPRVLGEPRIHQSTVEIVNGTEERLSVYLSPVSSTRIAIVEPHSTRCVPIVRTTGALVLVAVPLANGRRIYSPHFTAEAPAWRWTIKTRLLEQAVDLWQQPFPCENRRA